MIANISLKEMAARLDTAERVLLFPHENADGDSIGSCVGLCLALRCKGRDAWVVIGEKLPKYINFLDCGCCTADQNIIKDPDVCVAVDLSSDDRLGERLDKFRSAPLKLCIDHHTASSGYGDYYFIDDEEAAASQIMYTVICEMSGVKISADIATALFTGISTDTGNFRYSNTNPGSHRIAAELMETGIDHNNIIVNLYQNRDIREVMVQAKAYEVMETVADGKGVMSYMTRKMLKECNAEYEHVETAIDGLRDIEGVEIAAILKENAMGAIKCSLRAKSTGNVADIAKYFGGGGHIKAAGFTVKNMTMDEARGALRKEIEKACSRL